MKMAPSAAMLTCALWGILIPLSNAANPNLRMLFVSTSTYWFNYRHTNNALTLLESLSRGGENPNHKNTVVMIADDFECNVKSPAFQRYNENDTEISKGAAEYVLSNAAEANES
jgi:glycosylphosphatidylinositol transamidase (GPIT) subunit GPI8